MKRMINTNAAMLAEKLPEIMEVADNGDVTFGADVTADGDVSTGDGSSLDDTAKVLSGSEEVDDYYANEGDITFEDLPAALEFSYGHWRVSNNKLSIVISICNAQYIALDADADITNLGRTTLPTWVINKLVPYSSVALDVKLSQIATAGAGSIAESRLQVVKETTTISFRLYQKAFVAQNNVGNVRFEFNFLL